jgi:hypothetical protein
VVIPLFEKRSHILRAVESVLRQSFGNFELIVVDDGSTDGGADLVRQLSDSRITVLSQENRGAGYARNRGIECSNHDRVAFLDADDEWDISFLETVATLHGTYPDAGAYATAYLLSSGGKTWRPAFLDCIGAAGGGLLHNYFHSALGPPPICASAVMIPKSTFAVVGRFAEGVRRGEDLDLWERIALRYQIAWSPTEGAIYHLSSENRVCLSSRDEEVRLVSAVEEVLHTGSPTMYDVEVLKDYIAYVRLPVVLDLHLNHLRRNAVELLGRIPASARFRRRRILVSLALFVPSGVLKVFLVVRSRLRRD